jgi:hypothetical protein
VLKEIAERLERDGEECWQAIEGLATLDPAASRSIIEALWPWARLPGVATLLSLLAGARDEVMRAAARSALDRFHAELGRPVSLTRAGPFLPETDQVRPGESSDREARERPGRSLLPADRGELGIVHSVVTPVDGRGRGSVVISVRRKAQRRTAMFLCDLLLGIIDVVGEVEPESNRAGRLFDELIDDRAGLCVLDAHELALGLLAGSLMLGDGHPPPPVRDWIDGTLGPEFQPAVLPASKSARATLPIELGEMPERVRDVFDACPSWLDDSALAQELAEEIWLREGRVAADPDCDAGAYRYLFEHRLIHRLELYRRMLLWMGWLWRWSGQPELSRSAQVLADQLSDDQYAVPSHPFHVELTTRSLKAAQARTHP